MVIDDERFYRVLMFDSEEHYRRLIARLASATAPAALNNRALAHAELGEGDEALADFAEAIAATPPGPDAAIPHMNRGTFLARNGRIDEALADYGSAIAHAPHDPYYRRTRGIALHELGRYDDAIADYDEAIRAQPDFAGSYELRARAAARQPPE